MSLTMRYRLRTLLIVMAIAPPLLGGVYLYWRESIVVTLVLMVLAAYGLFVVSCGYVMAWTAVSVVGFVSWLRDRW